MSIDFLSEVYLGKENPLLYFEFCLYNDRLPKFLMIIFSPIYCKVANPI